MSLRRLSAAFVSLALIAIFAFGGYVYLRPIGPPTLRQPQPTVPATAATAQGSTSQAAASTPEPTLGPSSASLPATAPAATIATKPITVTGTLATIDSLDQHVLPRRDLVQLANEYGRTPAQQRVVRTTPLNVQVGQHETFWLSDIPNNRYYTKTATLQFALDHVLMYVEDGVEVNKAGLERSAHQFNDQIYPLDRKLFGEEWSPGVDGDPRLTVLNGKIAGVGGYFSGSDEVPRTVNRYSNEREMFYINIDDRAPGTAGYADVLAHEFQHMIEWHEAQRPTSWMNEGLSVLAEDLNGFTDDATSTAPSFLADPNLQLTAWASSVSPPHYGAAYLFLRYFYEQYGKTLDLKQLIRDDAGERLNLFAKQAATIRPDIKDFGQLFGDWAVANLLDDKQIDGGRYAYSRLPFDVTPTAVPSGGLHGKVAQFGTQYIDLPAAGAAQTVQWDGNQTTKLFPGDTQGAAWWSNRGDSADSVLTRTVDLRQVSAATLKFRLWYDIEKDYDYGYVSASTDGQHWQTLRGTHTTDTDPQGANYGNGYTSKSGVQEGVKSDETLVPQWLNEQIDLSSYAGKVITLRFSLITDDAYNGAGMVIDNLEIPQINFRDDVDQGAAGWFANGWERTDNQLPQRWELRLVRTRGNQTTVEHLTPNASRHVQAQLAADERGTLIIAATTPHTNEPATFTLSVSGGQ